MSLACALGLGHIADRLSRGDVLERAYWEEALARADRIAAARDERVAHLIASAVWG